MSVFVFQTAEIRSIYLAPKGPALERHIEEKQLVHHLHIAATANRAAFMLSYGESAEPLGDFTLGRKGYSHRNSVFDHISNLFYNCVSQGGVDFCPPDTKVLLMMLAHKADTVGKG